MKNIIHQTPEEQLANNSAGTLSAVSGLSPRLDEMNGHLKELKPSMQRAGSAQDFISNFVQSIKGDKGDKGDKGESIKGDKGDRGPQGIKGEPGARGPAGEARNGIDGKDAIHGTNGKDGKNGSPDTPDQVIEKINSANTKIDPKQIKGLRAVLETVDQIGKNPQGHYQNVGGANPLILLDSTGARLSDYITTIKFGSGVTPSYSAGVVTLTASGGSATIYTETPTGTIDGANKAYTTAHSTTTIIGIWINGQYIHTGEYTTNASGFTMGTALPSSLSGTGFTISYT